MNDRKRAARRVDRAIDRYADKIGYVEMELLLQDRAQDMRELAYQEGETRAISPDEIDW